MEIFSDNLRAALEKSAKLYLKLELTFLFQLFHI